MPELSVSSWSLHGVLGEVRYERTGDGLIRLAGGAGGGVTLLDLPGQVADHGIGNLEICHFHFSGMDDRYLEDVRFALNVAKVNFFSLLIDTGDITHPDAARREADLETIREWIEVAGRCGAGHVRVIAGDSEAGPETIRQSAKALQELARFGADFGVRVMTENFKKLTRRPAPLLEILDRCEGAVGLCADFGNFPKETREMDLEAILDRAESVHAKPEVSAEGEMDREGFRRCLDLARAVDFDGPYALIGDGWAQVEAIKSEVVAYL
ncbi:MAG: TIM barrel protein [bacterium]|nr:TIM barrel protein [bacterium]